MEKTELKERPIIMSAESVRAILEGRKTQTRRVIKPRYRDDEFGFNVCSCPATGEQWVEKADDEGGDFENGTRLVKCPYGRVGDRLWVRETFKIAEGVTINGVAPVIYKAECSGFALANIDNWKSPMFMPRWASRITLEITDIRVERLQDITESDAMAEGVKMGGGTAPEIGYSYRYGYSTLWDSLNAKRGYPWESNPWVWVVSFKVVEDGKD